MTKIMNLRLLLLLVAALAFVPASAVGDEPSDRPFRRELDARGNSRIVLARELHRGGGGRMTKSGKGAKGHKYPAPPPRGGSKSGKSSSPPPPHRGAKSGKSSGGRDDAYYLAPLGCPNRCVDADGADVRTGKLDGAVRSCSTHEMHAHSQQWILHEKDGMVKVESYVHEGRCIGVHYDRTSRVQQACGDGVLALISCRDPATYWYFTGGQLASFFCWSRGVSSTMGVSYDEDEGKCMDELRSHGVESDDTSLTMDTFMFVSAEDMYMLYDPSHDVHSPTTEPTRDEKSPTMPPTETPPADEPTNAPSEFPTYFPTTETSAPVANIVQRPRRPEAARIDRGSEGRARKRDGSDDGPIAGGDGRNRNVGIEFEDDDDDDDDVFQLGGRRR